MLGSYGAPWSSSSGYSSGNEATLDIKPFSEGGRMVTGDGRIVTSSYSHIMPHSSPHMYQPGSQHDNMVYVLPSDSKSSMRQMEILPKSAGSRWREEETMALVEIWRDKICQTRWWKQNKCVRVNKEMWDEIANMLMDKGIYRTASQCQIRMKNLLQYFRQLVDHRRTEKSRDELPHYFEIVNNIMNGRSEAEMWRKRRFEEGDDDIDDSMMSSEGANSNSERVEHNKSNASSPGPIKSELGPKPSDGKPSAMRHGSERMSDSPITAPVAGHRRPSSLSPHSMPPHDLFPARSHSISRHPLREAPLRDPEASGAGLLTTSMSGPTPSPYPPPPSQFPPHSIHHPDGFVIRNPTSQRFPMTSRVCLPITNHHLPMNEVGPSHPGGDLRCSSHGCCKEPPLKRHCPDVSCNTPSTGAKPGHFSDYSASKHGSRGAFPTQMPVEGPRLPPFARESNKEVSRSPISPPITSPSSTLDKSRDTKSSQSLGQSQEEWMLSMKELMVHQQKQMEMLLEVEQKRMEIEEKRLSAQEDADTRNGQFLVEAMRILAEALSKGVNTNIAAADTISKLNGTIINGDVSPTKE